MSYTGLVAKRIADFCAAIILLMVLSPFLVLMGLIISITMGNPIIFSQQRPGLHEKPFRIYKFRTMTDARDSSGNWLPDELRLTSFGKWLRKFSIDELPQLFNVLQGDLSLVGPRPLLMDYLPLYSSEQARRHNVKPGITGWAQVNGRNSISWEEKFQLDVWYVDHQSFWLDIKILWLTVLKVLNREGISQAGQATMEGFKGVSVK